MEHGPDISADGDSMLAEPQEDPDERWAEGWTWEKLLIERETTTIKGAVKNQTMFPIVMDEVMRYEP